MEMWGQRGSGAGGEGVVQDAKKKKRKKAPRVEAWVELQTSVNLNYLRVPTNSENVQSKNLQ